MTDLFKDVIPSILQTKKFVFEDEKDLEKTYVPYVVNRALSYYPDTIHLVNELNIYSSIPKKLQYLFLLNIVRSWKRPFSSWFKKEKIEDIEVVMEYYEFSFEKAKQALRLLTPDQIKDLKKQLDKGGSNVKTRRNAGDSI